MPQIGQQQPTSFPPDDEDNRISEREKHAIKIVRKYFEIFTQELYVSNNIILRLSASLLSRQ